MELNEYLNKYLIENDMSFREFAKKCGISHTYIANIVNDKTGRGTRPVLSYQKLKQIAKGMGVDINDFLAEIDVDIKWGQQESLSIISEDEIELINLWRSASDIGRARALGNLEAAQIVRKDHK